jgi:hypothetical protein
LISKSKEDKVWNIGHEPKSSALSLLADGSAQIISHRNYSGYFNQNNEYEYGNNSVVDVEVDCEKKTIYFFINKKQCPYYISDISSSFPLFFGFNSAYSPIFEVLSLFKILPSSSYVNPFIQCIPVKWVLIYFLIFILTDYLLNFIFVFFIFYLYLDKKYVGLVNKR